MRDVRPAILTGPWAIPACLAALACLSSATGSLPQDAPPIRVVSPDTPLRVSFRLADGVRVSGEMTAWDDVGLDGSFGRRRWSDLMLADARKLILRVIDQQSAPGWVRLGAIMLALEGGDAYADRAFARALQLDASVQPLVDRARTEAEAARRQREETEHQLDAARLATVTPETRQWPADPWPVLTVAEHQQAVAEMRGEAEQILRDAGIPMVPVMSELFIVYSDMERRETATWARKMDKTCHRLAELFGVADVKSFFWGKPAAFLLKDRDQFRLIEAQAFGHLPPASATGITHKLGPKVFIDVHRDDDTRQFEAALVHEVVHAFMHRYRTPRRLPPWANEGLAEYIVSEMIDDSIVDEERRRLAIDHVRGGGDPARIMALSYEDGGWTGGDALGPAIGYLITERMIESNDLAYVAWVDAVKRGKPWVDALREDAGTTPARLAWAVVRWYRVND